MLGFIFFVINMISNSSEATRGSLLRVCIVLCRARIFWVFLYYKGNSVCFKTVMLTWSISYESFDSIWFSRPMILNQWTT